MIVKVVQIRDVAIIEMDVAPCADVFIFTIRGREVEMCGKVFELSEELVFRKGLLILNKSAYFVECEEGTCIAAKTS
ncbi:MAG: hypothetical protein ABWK05_05045 [Pyrobaculum sp.]